MKLRPTAFRYWVIALFGVIGVSLFPWPIWRSSSLKAHHETRHWDLAWSGFDSGLALAFLLTAFAAWRRSPWVGALAAATGTLLITDAWFDIALESHSDELRNAVYLAAFAEVPVAVLCFWIAYRTERFLSLVLPLASATEGPAESDLVGVLEVTADGQPAGKAGDTDPPA